MDDVRPSQLVVLQNESRAFMDVEGLITVNNLTAFSEFGQVILHEPNITCDLSSHVQIDVEIWGMQFSVHDIQLNRALTFNALNNLPNVTLSVFTATTATDGTKHVIVSCTILLGNPTIVSIESLGNVTIDLFFMDSKLGSFEGIEPTLDRGLNTLHVVGPLTPDNITVLNMMLSNFLSGFPSQLTARGRSSTYKLFDGMVNVSLLAWRHRGVMFLVMDFAGLVSNLDLGANLTSKNSGMCIQSCLLIARRCRSTKYFDRRTFAGLLETGLVNVTIPEIERIIKTGIFCFPVSVKLLNPFQCSIHIKSLDLYVRQISTRATLRLHVV